MVSLRWRWWTAWAAPFLLLGQGDLQDAILILGRDLVGLDVPDVEAPAAGTGIALLADVPALLVLFWSLSRPLEAWMVR